VDEFAHQSKAMRVLWVNEAADFIGGCEQYIFNTVRLLREQGICSTLLYDCKQNRFSIDFIKPFDQAFPLVNVKTQVAEIKPDVVYIHRLSGSRIIGELKETGIPVARFFHDTKLTCPREHRYTTLRHTTCTKTMGMRCYFPCMGVINRSDRPLGVRLNPVRALRRELDVNKGLDAYVVASDYMADLLVEHGLSRDRIRLIPLYSLPPADIQSATRQPDLFMFAGQLIRSKGLDTLLHAVARTKHPCRLVIAGLGRQEEIFRGMVRRLGMEARVSFLGRIPHEELCKWYCKAVCVVLPVRQPESFALVGPEAMSYGTPVIATDIGGVGMWLESGKTGIAVPPNDPKALAQAMDQIASGDGLRETIRQNARRQYDAFFRPDRHIQALLRFFEELVVKGKS
jgi:glycosyltransferase involved in cell wall biosynthesis